MSIWLSVEIFPRILKKFSDDKFYENPSSGIRIIPCGSADGGAKK
jgi:hypothetical protein